MRIASGPASLTSTGLLREQEPMARHTTFRIGGPATAWVEPESVEDLRRTVEWACERGLPLVLLGEGSNLLVRDGGLDAVVVSLSAPAFRSVQVEEGARLRVGCGMPLGGLLYLCARHGLSGCEFLAGIPGTVGGSLVMNAGGGSKGNAASERPVRHFGELVESVTRLTPDGDVETLRREQLSFGYRTSNVSGGVLLEATLALSPDEPEAVRNRTRWYFDYKRRTQELGRPSAGCIFRNSSKASAGFLIESSGLKGYAIGGARVSTVHANFIINDGAATARDVLELMAHIQDVVRRQHGVVLEREVIVLGKD